MLVIVYALRFGETSIYKDLCEIIVRILRELFEKDFLHLVDRCNIDYCCPGTRHFLVRLNCDRKGCGGASHIGEFFA